MDTLLLDTVTWDLTVDTSGNIAVAGVPYAQAQDAASSIRTFAGEVYYDTTRGVPYFPLILGQAPPVSLMKSYFTKAALLVPGIVKARCFISRWTNRVVSGQVQIEDANGNISAAGF